MNIKNITLISLVLINLMLPTLQYEPISPSFKGPVNQKAVPKYIQPTNQQIPTKVSSPTPVPANIANSLKSFIKTSGIKATKGRPVASNKMKNSFNSSPPRLRQTGRHADAYILPYHLPYHFPALPLTPCDCIYYYDSYNCIVETFWQQVNVVYSMLQSYHRPRCSRKVSMANVIMQHILQNCHGLRGHLLPWFRQISATWC